MTQSIQRTFLIGLLSTNNVIYRDIYNVIYCNITLMRQRYASRWVYTEVTAIKTKEEIEGPIRNDLHLNYPNICYIVQCEFVVVTVVVKEPVKWANKNSINTFKTSILNFVRLRENSLFEVHDIRGVKLLIRLRLYFSHLNEHKF